MKPAWRISIITVLATLTLGFWLIQQDAPLRSPRIAKADLLPSDAALERGRELLDLNHEVAEKYYSSPVYAPYDVGGHRYLPTQEELISLYADLTIQRGKLRRMAEQGPIDFEGSNLQYIRKFGQSLISMTGGEIGPPSDELLADSMAHYSISRQLADPQWPSTDYQNAMSDLLNGTPFGKASYRTCQLNKLGKSKNSWSNPTPTCS